MGIFEGAYFALVMVASAVRVVYTRRYRRIQVVRGQRRGLDALLSGLPGLGMFVLPIIYVLTDWLDFADYHLPVWAGWLGVVLFGAAVWLLWRSHADLESSWSPRLEIMEGHSLVSHGVFRYIRHPMYAAHWLWGVAQVFLLQNLIAGFSMLVCMVPMYLYRVRVEERMMLEEFGDDYREYMARTGRILPRCWQHRTDNGPTSLCHVDSGTRCGWNGQLFDRGPKGGRRPPCGLWSGKNSDQWGRNGVMAAKGSSATP